MHGDRKRPDLPAEALQDHMVIVGYGRVGSHLVNVARELDIPHLVIESDVDKAESLIRHGTATLWGDAANSEILRFAGLERARAFITTLPEEAGAEMVVAAARQLNPDLPIVARAATELGVGRLAELGAQDVIHPELEGGLEIVTRAMLRLGFPLREVLRYTDAVRHDRYEIEVNSDQEHQMLHDLLDSVDSMDITWLRLPDDSHLIGKTLVEADLRNRSGASVVAMTRDGQLIANPKSYTVFERGDRLGLIGDAGQMEAVTALLTGGEHEATEAGSSGTGSDEDTFTELDGSA